MITPTASLFLFLQWGRNLFVAESKTSSGTATTVDVLQWGRNLFVAERAMRSFDAELVLIPSMGPQLVRCGKYLKDVQNVPVAVLQWGRNLFVAESWANNRRRR